MKSVAVTAFLALAATTHGFVVSPASTCVARPSAAVTAQATSPFMSRRVDSAPTASSGALKMSDSMNDAQQPTLEQVVWDVVEQKSSLRIVGVSSDPQAVYKRSYVIVCAYAV